MNAQVFTKSMNSMTTLSDGTITITEGNIVFSDGSVLDSIENIALLNADNVMTGTNTLTGDVKITLPRRRVSTQTGHWWSREALV
jgi:hypothetical protein